MQAAAGGPELHEGFSEARKAAPRVRIIKRPDGVLGHLVDAVDEDRRLQCVQYAGQSEGSIKMGTPPRHRHRHRHHLLRNQ